MARQKENKGQTGEQPRISSALARILEMPETALSDVPTIEISGNTEAVIDGCKGIVEYSEEKIRINTGRLILCITGRNLQLKCMTAQSAVVIGYLLSIGFSV